MKKTATLFSKAKKVTKPETKKDDKQIVVVPGITPDLERLSELRDLVSEYTAEMKMLEGTTKELAKEKFVELYQDNGNPGSFRLEGDKGGKILVIPMDRYITIQEDRADQISEQYGEELVEVKTTFAFNPDVLARNEETISKLIMTCKDITKKDKENLIVAESKFSIAKGSIKNLLKYGGKLKEVFEAINPVFQLKNCR